MPLCGKYGPGIFSYAKKVVGGFFVEEGASRDGRKTLKVIAIENEPVLSFLSDN